MRTYKPTKAELLAAAGKTLPDLIAEGLKVLFCGINPGLYTAAVGHHFARPGNRFWPALHQAGFTERLYSPFEEERLLDLGYGITNLVARATASAAELTVEEYIQGGRRLEQKIKRYRPICVSFVGIGAYRVAFGRPKALLGRQPDRLGDAMIWTLPSTSGLNANHKPADLARLFAELREAIELKK
jgi:TDG/mug DNA glycosylase family protein